MVVLIAGDFVLVEFAGKRSRTFCDQIHAIDTETVKVAWLCRNDTAGYTYIFREGDVAWVDTNQLKESFQIHEWTTEIDIIFKLRWMLKSWFYVAAYESMMLL